MSVPCSICKKPSGLVGAGIENQGMMPGLPEGASVVCDDCEKKVDLKKLNKEEVIEDHIALHKSLDRLAACWISGYKDGELRTPSRITLMEFFEWSAKQTQEPECFKEGCDCCYQGICDAE